MPTSISLTPPDDAAVNAVVRAALAEDVGTGDATAALAPGRPARARLICREEAILCGRPWFDAVYRELDRAVGVHWQAQDGDRLLPGQTVCEITGPAPVILTGERTALNFLQTLSGTATLTRRYVDAVAGSAARIFDTRKTLPGLRVAQKYAVRCGGGCNQRMGLFDAMLIKENHIAAAGGITAAVRAARQRHPDLPLQVEVETIEQLTEVLDLGVESVLLDNFDLEQLERAVAVRVAQGRVAALEASGGIGLAEVARIAATGVDRISVGGLTKHVQAVDYSLRIIG
ncbi:carboxylating nicotinate-nucleotide diphosphorylase [Candidatus Macondimonas diazotrophica]|jgi:nicotinate-nucleotide pyrophosphorylase (carboxylating)|uniref:Probable nicotinate-nucleotide pyrophosphorylase [carboxylating] n=1 Tax=Candidatus Macondimonas diazotrophica TaxID=2305248 RepID=A0A4Z0FEV7_9GAMM|nr:carboxylating nicotinate-nucleotide diphosphorylase [Candidatus Macondimonas diazotrophica]TFZ84192.1 carboxylating nicotinate-nucleotide diphosphorylase [Candidatus Macondimonas diazotrophica]